MPAIECVPFTFNPFNNASEYITGDIRYIADTHTAKPIIIIVHGFKGFKDWGFFPYIAEHFARLGFITITINFSLNGYKPSADIVVSPENFARNTISREVAEIHSLINGIRAGNLHSCLVPYTHNPLYMLGHSRGGGITILATSQSDEIRKAAVWNSVATFDRFTERQKQKWIMDGGFPVENARTGQSLILGLPYLNDIINNAEKLSLTAAISAINKPFLIVHGEQDLTVPLREAHKLREFSSEHTRLCIIARTGHTFGAVHPFQGSTQALDEALKVTTEFFMQ